MINFFQGIIKTDHLPDEKALEQIPQSTFGFIWFFVKQEKYSFILFSIIWAIASGLTMLGYYYVQIAVDAFNAATIKNNIWDSLAIHFWGFIGLFLIAQTVLARVGMAMFAEMRPHFMSMIRRQLTLYVYKHNYNYFQNEFAGRISSKVLETPYAIISIVFNVITSFGFAFIVFCSTVFMFAMTGFIFFAIIASWIIAYIVLLRFYAPKIMELSKISHDKISFVRGRYVDTLTNISSVFLFGRKKYEDRVLVQSLQDTSVAGAKAWHMTNIMQIWLEVLSCAFIAAVFYAAIEGWRQDELTTGQVAMVLPLMLRVMDLSWWVSDIIFDLFDHIGQVREGKEAIFSQPIEPEQQTEQINIKTPSIELKDLFFQYGSQTVFKNFNLDIPAQQKIGLVGKSGAGKTTLTNLLLRLYDIHDGHIMIDGQNVSHFTRQSVRDQIAIIPQHTDMLHRSLLDNIRYGQLDATDEEIIAAAKKAHAHDFIADLPEGYDTLVGERGVKLSGGQRQRIAIARAILKDAPILILDEATSALDSESERLIQDSLKTLMEGKTVIAIAHRLSTIAHLDRLIVMHEGEIVEDGSHDDLLKIKNGHYAKLWAMQSGGFLKDD